MNNIERYETSFVIPVANESNNWLTTQPASLDFVISNLTDVCNILRTKTTLFNHIGLFTLPSNDVNAMDRNFLTIPPSYFSTIDFDDISLTSEICKNHVLILFNDQDGHDDRILFYPQSALTVNGNTGRYQSLRWIFSIFCNKYWYTINPMAQYTINNGANILTYWISNYNSRKTTDEELKDFMGAQNFSNSIKEIIIINENTIALSMGPYYSDSANIWSKGIIIFTKTNTGNICMIHPSRFYAARHVYNSRVLGGLQYGPEYNYLSAISSGSTHRPFAFNTIPFESAFGDKTILNPVLVNGSTEYCPDCFYVPVSQYILDKSEDTVLSINGEKYYYNGFIAVKIY